MKEFIQVNDTSYRSVFSNETITSINSLSSFLDKNEIVGSMIASSTM